MVLVLEALTIAFVNWILGLAVRHQEMSLAGLHPERHGRRIVGGRRGCSHSS